MFCLYCNTQYRAYFLNLKRFDIRKDLPEKIVKAFEIVATGPDVTAFNIARARDSFTVSRETDAHKRRVIKVADTTHVPIVASAPLNSQWKHDYAIVRKFMAGRRAFHYSPMCISRIAARFLAARRISAAGAAVSLNFHR